MISLEDDYEKAAAFLSSPEGFAKGVLGFDLNPKQIEIVNEFDDLHSRTKVACSAPNGAGKSSKINATIILRTIATKPQSKVIVTSADSRQLDNQIWPALLRHQDKFPARLGWRWREHDRQIISPEGGFLLMFTTDQPGRAEGWHCEFDYGNNIDSPVLIICDEAKSIDESIFDAFSARCTFNGLFYVSSTGLMTGSFYDAMCGKGGFKRYSLGLKDCPHISKQRIEELLEEYKDNPDHPLLRSTLYGEFMDFSGDQGRFVNLKDIQACLAHPPVRFAGETVAFCDFAGGGAENVLAVRRGTHVELIRCWRETNEMAAVGDFIRLFIKHGIKAEQVWGDNAGAGKPMIAAFHESGWPINRFNGGSEALRPTDYADRNAEVWEMAGRDIKGGKVAIPDDSKLHEQMVNRRRTADSKGRIKAESKVDMAKRGAVSPDRADAILGVIALKPLKIMTKADGVVPSWIEYIDQHANDAVAYNLPGADLGS